MSLAHPIAAFTSLLVFLALARLLSELFFTVLEQDVPAKIVRAFNVTTFFLLAWIGLLILAQLLENGSMSFIFWAVLLPFAILLWLGLIAAVITMGLYVYALHQQLRDLRNNDEQHEQIGDDECQSYNPLSSGRTSL